MQDGGGQRVALRRPKGSSLLMWHAFSTMASSVFSPSLFILLNHFLNLEYSKLRRWCALMFNCMKGRGRGMFFSLEFF